MDGVLPFIKPYAHFAKLLLLLFGFQFAEWLTFQVGHAFIYGLKLKCSCLVYFTKPSKATIIGLLLTYSPFDGASGFALLLVKSAKKIITQFKQVISAILLMCKLQIDPFTNPPS